MLGSNSGLSGTFTTGLDERLGGVPTAEDLLIEHQAHQQTANAMGLDDEDPEDILLDDEQRFRLALKAYTLISPVKVEVLVARMVRGLTFKEIAIEFGYADAGTAGRAYRDALEMLQRGVK